MVIKPSGNLVIARQNSSIFYVENNMQILEVVEKKELTAMELLDRWKSDGGIER